VFRLILILRNWEGVTECDPSSGDAKITVGKLTETVKGKGDKKAWPSVLRKLFRNGERDGTPASVGCFPISRKGFVRKFPRLFHPMESWLQIPGSPGSGLDHDLPDPSGTDYIGLQDLWVGIPCRSRSKVWAPDRPSFVSPVKEDSSIIWPNWRPRAAAGSMLLRSSIIITVCVSVWKELTKPMETDREERRDVYV